MPHPMDMFAMHAAAQEPKPLPQDTTALDAMFTGQFPGGVTARSRGSSQSPVPPNARRKLRRDPNTISKAEMDALMRMNDAIMRSSIHRTLGEGIVPAYRFTKSPLMKLLPEQPGMVMGMDPTKMDPRTIEILTGLENRIRQMQQQQSVAGGKSPRRR